MLSPINKAAAGNDGVSGNEGRRRARMINTTGLPYVVWRPRLEARTEPLRIIDDDNDDDYGMEAVRKKLMLDLETDSERIMRNAISEKQEEEVEEEHTPANVLPRKLRSKSKSKLKVEEKKQPSSSLQRNNNDNDYSAPRKKVKLCIKSSLGKKQEEEEDEQLPVAPALASELPWKLRSKSKTNCSSLLAERNDNETQRVKLCVKLSESEVGEDFMKMMGHLQPRKPNKRPFVVQKQIDTLFPAQSLTEVTADLYKVHESPVPHPRKKNKKTTKKRK